MTKLYPSQNEVCYKGTHYNGVFGRCMRVIEDLK